MVSADEFATGLLEEAKRFLEKARAEGIKEGRAAYLHAALLVGFAALEAHVNCIADDFLVGEDLTTLDRSILAEKDFELKSGEFVTKESLRMYRLEDRIEYLHRRFSGAAIDKQKAWWSYFKKGLVMRNELTHSKGPTEVEETDVARILEGILELIDHVYRAVYKKKFPARRRGLDSHLSF